MLILSSNVKIISLILSRSIADFLIGKSINGILTLLSAKTVVISNSLLDFFPYFKASFRKEAVQLWHGIKWSKQYE